MDRTQRHPALSALTTITGLENEGYALMPL
jgi:hypothetical protein